MDRGIRVRLRGQELTFPAEAEVRLGRDPGMDIHTDNPLVSRRHAVLKPHVDGWLLEDTDSSHGTFLDGRRIARAVISEPSTVWLAEPGEGQVLLLLPNLQDAPEPTGVFMSYRRSDSSGYSGRLYDGLCAHFGEQQLFRDLDTVAPGTDFLDRIERAVGSCRVLIAVVGQGWADARGRDGGLRLHDARDLVRLEIEAALQRPHVRLIPVLVAGATMPAAAELPESLQELAFRQALEMTDARWEFDLSRLVKAIESSLGPAPDHEPRDDPPPDTPPPGRPQPEDTAGMAAPAASIPLAWWLLPLLLFAFGGVVAWFALRGRNPHTARSMLIFGIGWSVVVAALC